MSYYLYEHKTATVSLEQWSTYSYCIDISDIKSTMELCLKLWQYRNTGGALSRNLIENLIKCKLLFKNADISNVSNASYDLTLGDECFYEGKIKTLDDKNPFIEIKPYDYVIASCKEEIAMPRDVSARFDVAVNLFFQGIILSNSTQVDPGFSGKLFCLLFNTSDSSVYLKRGQQYATIEFNKLIEPTTAYSGKHLNELSISSYLPNNIMRGAINQLKIEIEDMKKEYKKTQDIYLTVLALLVAAITFLISMR